MWELVDRFLRGTAFSVEALPVFCRGSADFGTSANFAYVFVSAFANFLAFSSLHVGQTAGV
jgi:hypothetical protein